MKGYIKKTYLWILLRDAYIKRYIKRHNKINNLMQKRNKLFPGKMRLVDLYNARYISRKPIYDFLISNVDKLNGKVLDFGCGSMEYRKLLKNAVTYTGLDIEGAEKNGFIGAGKVIYYDGVHIPFTNEYFDSVLAIEVFEHVEKLEEVLGELNRVVKSGGFMLFTVPMNFPLHLQPWDYRRFTNHGIRKMLCSAGFKVIEIKGSTTFKNTLRRLQIIQESSYKSWRSKVHLVVNNICFALSNNVADNEMFPIDWLVICEKMSINQE